MDPNDQLTINGVFRLNIIKRHLSQSNAAQKKPVQAQLKYTIESGKLTAEQREFYEQNGFVVIGNLIDSEKLDKYRKRFQGNLLSSN